MQLQKLYDCKWNCFLCSTNGGYALVMFLFDLLMHFLCNTPLIGTTTVSTPRMQLVYFLGSTASMLHIQLYVNFKLCY